MVSVDFVVELPKSTEFNVVIIVIDSVFQKSSLYSYSYYSHYGEHCKALSILHLEAS